MGKVRPSLLLSRPVLPPPPPLWPLTLGAGCRLGGTLLYARPLLGSRALRARREPLPVPGVPLAGVLSLALSAVPPRSLAARHGRALLGGVSPSPFPPSSAACVRRARLFGGPLSFVALLAVSCSSRALLGVSPPPPPSVGVRVLWPHGRPRPAQAPRWLGRPPTRPYLLRTHNAGACRFRW